MTEIAKNNINYYKKKHIYSIEIIKKIINKNASEYNFFKINKIYIFGSYAKNRQNEYSDIDLHIITDVKTNVSAQEYILSCLFSNMLNAHVDVVVTFGLDNSLNSLFNQEIKIYDVMEVNLYE